MQQSIAGKKKAKEVTMATWIEMVKQTQQYKSGEWVRVGVIHPQLANHGASTSTTRNVLEKMCSMGYLAKRQVSMGTKVRCEYMRRRSDVDWLAVPWRKRSNEGLGIRPDRLGVMGR